jgi:hypothetical protein
MKWRKLGRIFAPTGEQPWMRSHASNPTPDIVGDGLLRVYFSCRDEQQRSSIAFVEVQMEPPFSVQRVSPEPAITPGARGVFDDSGASIGCITAANDQKYLYYVGWNLSVTVPWRNSVGMAIYQPATDCWLKIGRAPVLDRSEIDPLSLSYPCVLHSEGAFRMWYGSNLSWGEKRGDLEHVIKYAESTDGRSWRRDGTVAINFKDGSEYAIARPWVIRDPDCYRMWYSCRGGSYRIGYAESRDGISWERKDELAGIDVSAEGWDAEMVCYASVFDFKGLRYMLYNGNGYGQTGFGLAVQE